MKRTELLKEIVKKQDEIIRLLSYNDAFFNVRIAVLNEEVTVIKADLKQLEECEENESDRVIIDEAFKGRPNPQDVNPYDGRARLRKINK